MERRDCSTKRKKYTHLNERERIKLEVLVERKEPVKVIAAELRKHRATIYREIKRGSIDWVGYDLSKKKRYRAEVGQRKYIEKAKNKERTLKIGKDLELAEYIKRKILCDRYSPDAVIGEIRRKGLQFERMICTKTVYNYIDAGILAGVSNANLWEKRKRRKHRDKIIRRISWKNRRGRSIEERPREIEAREEYGHWEGDCIKGAIGTKASILTLTERKTLEEVMIKLKDGKQESVKRVFDQLERKYGDAFSGKFKTITFDNGGEFSGWEALEMSINDPQKRRITIYYAHAYSSWERGSNENQNRMIRRFIPKGMALNRVTQEDLKRIQHWMNKYPRKKLGYMSANEVATACMQNISQALNSFEFVAL